MLVKIVGNNIKRLRIPICKREDFALAHNIDLAYLGSIERGQRNIELGTVQKIAHYLGVPPHELFRENDTNMPFPTLELFTKKYLAAFIRPALLDNYDPLDLLALYDSDLLFKLTVQDIENGARSKTLRSPSEKGIPNKGNTAQLSV